jgi:hypothetical protein
MADATSTSVSESQPETLEALQARHRKEQRDLAHNPEEKTSHQEDTEGRE